ncbi:MAG: hypothetical protein J6S67_16385 [Methanobrevibacter sp.]|nr:hypothetical protein [Methanobrevibacter sp.]
MNKLGQLLYDDVQLATKKSKGNQDKFIEYMCSGSIIAFIKDHNGTFEIHGDTTSGKIFVLTNCIRHLSEELDISENALIDFIKNSMCEDKPF